VARPAWNHARFPAVQASAGQLARRVRTLSKSSFGNVVFAESGTPDTSQAAKAEVARRMDSTQLFEQGVSLIVDAPIMSLALVVIGGIAAWLLASRMGQHRLIALQRHFEARDETKLLIEERLAAVMRNEDMLKTQVAALQEHFHVVESQVLHEGRVPALIAATGSTASTITNIALTTEALAGSLTVLRLGVGDNNNRPSNRLRIEPPEVAAAE
jgi:hypothetical protein